MKQVAPHVYGLVGGAVNVYILDDGDAGLTIVDTGLSRDTKRVLALTGEMGRSPTDVKQILITHADVDHVGGLKSLVDATRATVYAGAETARYIRLCQSPPHITYPMKLVVGVVNRLTRRPVPVDHLVGDDDLLNIAGGIRVIATPGHTHDHFSYYWERENILFAGDLLDNDHQLTLSQRSVWNHAELEKSARRVLALHPSVICPGHGQVWLEDEDLGQLSGLKL